MLENPHQVEIYIDGEPTGEFMDFFGSIDPDLDEPEEILGVEESFTLEEAEHQLGVHVSLD